MHLAIFLLLLAGSIPLALAWMANRSTSLIQAVNWTLTAWLAWLATTLLADRPGSTVGMDAARYLALSLTGCSGIAVLGARRPHVGAWNFVVLGLLAILVLPLVEGMVTGSEPLGTLRLIFLGAILSVGILNYLPTRLAVAALFLALGCAGEMFILIASNSSAAELAAVDLLSLTSLALSPWLSLGAWRRQAPNNEFDRLWLDFRNRFGLVWGQRVREQFNASAAHAGWPVYLFWIGLRRTAPGTSTEIAVQVEMVETLKALLKRFGPAS